MRIKLTQHELEHAAMVGHRRALTSWARGDRNRNGTYGGVFDPHIHGAIAEYVVSKGLNIHWRGGVDEFTNVPDLDPDIEVRWSRKPNLIIRPNDLKKHTGKRFVLVNGKQFDYQILGWLRCEDAERREWWQAPHDRAGAYFVPADKLETMPILAKTLNRKTTSTTLDHQQK